MSVMQRSTTFLSKALLSFALVSGASSVASESLNAAPGKAKARVFVEATPSVDGSFVEPEQKRKLDSAKDVIRYLKKHRRLEITKLRDDADVVVMVESSQTESVNGSTMVGFADPKSGIVVGAAEGSEVNAVGVRLIVGDYQREFRARADTWSGVAQDIAKQVAGWIKDNEAALLDRRARPD